MINNIASMDMRPQMAVAKATPSISSFSMPPILGFKTIPLKEKATIRVKKLKRGDNIAIPGIIEDDYVDVVEETLNLERKPEEGNFFNQQSFIIPVKRKIQYLKNCYIIDYIQSPKPRCGLGAEAVKALAEKAMFDPKAEGRIVTFSAPLVKESSPALFFYKLGFRFTSSQANEYMEECLRKKVPDIPVQTGMMYLPKNRLHKLLHYGELF